MLFTQMDTLLVLPIEAFFLLYKVLDFCFLGSWFPVTNGSTVI